jgi:hypothetical protein
MVGVKRQLLHHVVSRVIVRMVVGADAKQEVPEAGNLSTTDGDTQRTPQVGHETGGVKHRGSAPGFTGNPLETLHILHHHLVKRVLYFIILVSRTTQW